MIRPMLSWQTPARTHTLAPAPAPTIKPVRARLIDHHTHECARSRNDAVRRGAGGRWMRLAHADGCLKA